jgi:drug/metabolite transporter (DMT)-like permease
MSAGGIAGPDSAATAIGAAAALGSAASWALGAVLFRRLGDRLRPIALTFAKGVVGALLLGICVATVGYRPVSAQVWMLLVLSGLLGIAIGDTLFFLALNRLGAQAVVVMFTLGQVLTVLFAVLWLGERPDPFAWAGIVLILSGVTTVMWSKLETDSGRTTLGGALYGLFSVLAMSVSVIVAKEAVSAAGSVQATFVRMLAGTAGIFLFGHLTGRLAGGFCALREPRFLAFFLLSVAVVTFGGFWLAMVAIAHVDVAIANTLNGTEPLFVLPLAAVVLRERIGPAVLLGSLTSVAGIALVVAPR